MGTRRSWHAAVIGAVLVVGLAAPAVVGATTKITHPSAPRAVRAVAGNASATVSWVKPASNGGAAIKTYVVTSRPANRTCTVKVLKCRITGLRNGTAYTFTVVARNVAGTSPRSAASNKVTPKAPPIGPTLVVTPSTNLVKGQTVSVSGSGFTPNDQVYLVECLVTASGQGGCNIATATPVTISATGVLPTTNFIVVTGVVGSGSCGTTASNLKSCAISAGNATGGDSASAPIAFKLP